jgi:hypothetical protein
MNRRHFGLTLIALGLLGPSLANAQEDVTTYDPLADAVPSGTVEIEGRMLKLIVGGGSGKGVLHYQGEDYPFTAKALTAGGAGYTEVKATGNVYFLDKLEDFPGTYTAMAMGGAIGKGKGGSRFKNSKGVFMVLEQESKGLAAGLSLGGMQVTLVQPTLEQPAPEQP